VSRNAPAWRLLAYDVRCPRRLRRLHYRLRREVAYVQESVALVRLDDEGVDALLGRLAEWLGAEDDLRIYELNGLHEVWLAGPVPLPGAAFGAPVTARPGKAAGGQR
jgi:CRISPR/Cas system-associated endoribonuclease Cas2